MSQNDVYRGFGAMKSTSFHVRFTRMKRRSQSMFRDNLSEEIVLAHCQAAAFLRNELA